MTEPALSSAIAAMRRALDENDGAEAALVGMGMDERLRRRRAASDALAKAIAAAGGKSKVGPTYEAKVTLAGVSSTSTAGLPAAARNWMTAARRRLLETERAAG